MAPSGDELWLDADGGRLVRPYAVSEGRTSPAIKLDMMSLVMTTGRVPMIEMDPDREQTLTICAEPTPIAEIAARLRLPAVVTKIIICDLQDAGAVITRPPREATDLHDPSLLQAVLDGLQRL
ncbi:MAG TPA: DUF742 domain-containing protein [Streptosporangiaceae bacterium]|nr:DUF742 domain-containing protein [Streptosporangiaceae bacterium]